MIINALFFRAYQSTWHWPQSFVMNKNVTCLRIDQYTFFLHSFNNVYLLWRRHGVEWRGNNNKQIRHGAYLLVAEKDTKLSLTQLDTEFQVRIFYYKGKYSLSRKHIT